MTDSNDTLQEIFDRACMADRSGDPAALALYRAVFDRIRESDANRDAAIHVLQRMMALLVGVGRFGEAVALADEAPWWRSHAMSVALPLATAHHELGVAAIRTGDVLLGRGHLRMAQALAPDLAPLQENLRRCELHLARAMAEAMQKHVESWEGGVLEVSRRFVPPEDMEALAEDARRKLIQLAAMEQVTAAVLIPHLPDAASGSCALPDQGRTGRGEEWGRIESFADFDTFMTVTSERRFDILIATNHWFSTAESWDALSRFRQMQPDCVTMIWLWDNHHLFYSSIILLRQFDVIVPAHEIATGLLKAFSPNVLGAVPAAVFQWSAVDAGRFFDAHAGRERSDRLYGSFFAYQNLERDGFIERCRREVPDNDLYLRPRTLAAGEDQYLTLKPEGQFADWMRYKVSLVATVKTDIPVRLFDALLTGQIPLVPSDLEALDVFLPIEAQRRLPVLRYNRHSLASVIDAHQRAIILFNQDGLEGALRRHVYVASHHMVLHRISEMIGKALLVAGV